MRKWNRVEVVYEGKPISLCSFQADASTSYGAGAFFEGEELSVEWDGTIKGDINVLEVFAILLAARKWGHAWGER